METRLLTHTDLKAVANIHMLAFSDAALTKLGPEAIRRYYLWQLNGPHDSICIGAFADTQLAGFCFGGVFRNSETGFLHKNRFYLLWRFTTHPWLLTNEMVWKRVGNYLQDFNICVRKVEERIELPTPPVNERFGILSIAVHPNYRRLGVGKLLMHIVEEAARQKGFNSIRLSVHPNNSKAVLFYEKLGWRKVQADDQWRGFMTKDLESRDVMTVLQQ